MPGTRPLLLLSLTIGFLGPAARGDDKPADPLASALGRSIIGKGQSLAEVKDYAAALVPQMPELSTVEAWEAFAAKTRAEALRRVVFRGGAAAWRDAKARVEWLGTVDGGPGYEIKKVRYEAVPGLWVPALLYEPEGLKGKVPVVLNVNGHDPNGKAADYKQVRCINLAKRGMIALNVEWFQMGQLRSDGFRHDQINHLDLCGASGVGVFYLAMTRGIDLLLDHPHADPARVAVTGLSGGGWQTIFVSAFDTRVTLANPVAGYSSFRTRVGDFTDLGDSEQTPNDLAVVTDYGIMTALMAPRALLLTYNAKDDCCFASGHALPPLLDAASPVYALYDRGDRLRSHVNHDPGTHNYREDNRRAFYRMAGDAFFPGDPSYPVKEIPSDKEVKTKDELNVPLPSDNLSLHGLALDLSRDLPRDGTLPKDRDAARSWADAKRAKLREVVRFKQHDVQAVSHEEETKDGLKATFWRLKVGDWTVPVVEMVKTADEPSRSVILVADKGRGDAATVTSARRWLDDGARVLAVDPFYLGEAKVAEKDYLFALLLAAVGDRPLGIQATEIAAVARWVQDGRKGGTVALAAEGPRSSVMALTAAALEPEAINSVSLTGSYGSLKELIETNATYNASPELFCFGLLEHADILQLAALAAPRKVDFHRPSDRARKELGGLKAWYATWDVEHEPLR
jgi:hypothetical protein